MLTRITALEKKLEEGVVVKGVENVPASKKVEKEEVSYQPPVRQEEKAVVEREEEYVPEMEAPPDEAETGGNV